MTRDSPIGRLAYGARVRVTNGDAHGRCGYVIDRDDDTLTVALDDRAQGNERDPGYTIRLYPCEVETIETEATP